MSFKSNVYYHPEKCGVELLAVLDDDTLSYEYDTVIAVKANGRVYLAHDAGCSCPTPFDEVRSLDDMTAVHTAPEVVAFIEGVASTYRSWPGEAVRKFLREVEEGL